MCAHGSCHHQQGPCSRQSFWSDACFGILKGVPSQLSSIDPKFKTLPMGIKVADSFLPSHMDSAVTNDERRYSFHTLVVSVILRVQRSSRNAPYAPQRGRSVASGCLVPSSSPPGFAANSPSSSLARPH
ncbi:hypothetical protein AB1N83_002602 [Pleurotus pulmonarius]